jgi:formylmethanofuran dehydrogenase subunit B
MLCDDIELTMNAGKISKVKNLCRKGHGHFQGLYTERTIPMIDGQKVSLDQAIKKAADILKQFKHPLLYGWSNTSLAGQGIGIDLARSLKATIDGTSSFCQGKVMELVLSGKLPTCTLDDVRNFADTSIFWGSDPSNSHPRLLSRFVYYPRGSKRQKSYEEERTCLVVDVRKSSTTKLCDNYFRLAPGDDVDFLSAMMSVLDGKIPKFGDKKLIIELGTILKKTEFGAIFPGIGMISSMHNKMDLFQNLVVKLNEISPFKVIPTVEHFNTRGFCQLMFENTSFVNRVSFESEKPSYDPKNSVNAASKEFGAALVIGSDPLCDLPFGTAKSLSKLPLIAVDSHRSLTTDASRVVIPSAIYGLEAAGSAIRMDGSKIEFERIASSEALTDEEILVRIKEEIC